MQISISARHGQLSDESRATITEKLNKLTRFFDRISSIELTTDLSHDESPAVELLVSAEHKHDFVAHDQSDNLMSSVDTVMQKMEKQLRKYKEKIQEHHRGTKNTETPELPETEDLE